MSRRRPEASDQLANGFHRGAVAASTQAYYLEWLEYEGREAVRSPSDRTPSSIVVSTVDIMRKIAEDRAARQAMLAAVGCCGCRDAYGVCKLTLVACRIVAAAIREVERTSGRKYHDWDRTDKGQFGRISLRKTYRPDRH